MELERSNPPRMQWIYIAAILVTAALLVFFGVELRYAFGIPYIFVFMILCGKHPELALMLIFALAPFQQDIALGGPLKLSFSELSLALAFPAFIMKRLARKKSPFVISPIMLPIMLYFGIAIFSSWANWQGKFALISLMQMFLYCFCAVSIFSSFLKNEEDIIFAFNGLIITCVFFGLLMPTPIVYELGLHKNGIGGSLSGGLIVCTELWLSATDRRRRKLLTLALIIISMGLVFSLSRGSWLGGTCGLFLVFAMRRRFKALFRMAIVLIPLIAICWTFIPEEKQEYALDFDMESWNIKARFKSIEIAKKEFRKSPLYGVGVGLRKKYDATNIGWLVLAETGVFGAVAFTLIYVVFFRMALRAQAHLIRGEPLYSIVVIGTALFLDKLVHGMVDHYWSRGVSMLAWAGAGMTISVYFLVKQRAREEKNLS